MARKYSPYFEDFITMGAYSVRAAEYLQTVLTNFSAASLSEQRKKMHEIEHEEDGVRHDVMKRLVKEFVTPIDREDIIALANQLDTVTDKIDDILIRMYMYNISEVPLEAVAFADVVLRCCKAMHAALVEFPYFQKSAKLMEAIIEVNNVEEEGDAMYIESVRKIYDKNSKDPLAVIAWSELFDRLEECCDACEDVADLMETIAMKNA